MHDWLIDWSIHLRVLVQPKEGRWAPHLHSLWHTLHFILYAQLSRRYAHQQISFPDWGRVIRHIINSQSNKKIDCIHEESRTADDVTVKLVGEGSHTTSLLKFQNLSTPPKPVFKNVSVTLRQIEKHQLITSKEHKINLSHSTNGMDSLCTGCSTSEPAETPHNCNNQPLRHITCAGSYWEGARSCIYE